MTCRACRGEGQVYVPGDWVPYGSTVVQTPGYWGPCEDCEGEDDDEQG